jgi:hypothetical protein
LSPPAPTAFPLEFAREAGLVGRNMNKAEIAATLRNEVGELEVLIKKLQARLERSKRLVLDIEEEIAGPETKKTAPESQFRKVIDQVFGEKPNRPKR